MLYADNSGATYLWSDGSTEQTLEVYFDDMYLVTVTNGGICSSTGEVIVSYTTAPYLELGNEILLCNGEMVTLDAENSGASYLWSDGSTDRTLEVYDQGTYNVIVTYGGMCSTTDGISIDAHTTDTTVSIVSDITFMAEYESPATFEWINCSDMTTVGTEQSFTAMENGSFAVVITDDFYGCPNTSSCYQVTNVGINESAQTRLSVYPNPTSSRINVNVGTKGNFKVRVTNVRGQVVRRASAKNTSQYQMDVSDLGKGIYFIHVDGRDRSDVIKFVKN